MRTPISNMQLFRPRSVIEALRMLRNEGPLTPLAGATDLYVAVNFGTLTATRFLDLWTLAPLRRITLRDETLHIGALATYTELLRSRLVRRRVPMLASAAREVGGRQIQNRGTIGGNVANGSPAGDTLEIPPVEGRQWFRKVGTRAAQAISKVVMAAVRGSRPRIALGSVAPTVVRLRRVEQELAEGASIEDAARHLDDDIRPIDDLRSTAAYRRDVAANLLRRFWADTGPDAEPA